MAIKLSERKRNSMAKKQTAGRDRLGGLAPKFAELNDDVILSILVDTFFTRISMPKRQHPEIHSISVV